MRGKCQGFVLYRQTWQCNENITDCEGKRAVVLPTGCPRSAGLLAGICRTKVKVPAIPRGWGGPWLQMTSALSICVLLLVHKHDKAQGGGSAAKFQKWIGVRFERGLSASRRISQLGSPLGGVRPI